MYRTRLVYLCIFYSHFPILHSYAKSINTAMFVSPLTNNRADFNIVYYEALV